MPNYTYGVPTSSREPPACYGKSYDNDHRECRGCSFQNTCREQVVRAKNAMTGPTTSDYYRQFGYGGTNVAPLRAPVLGQPVPQTTLLNFGSPQQIAQPQQRFQQAAPPGYPGPVKYGDYGWMQDPLHYALASAPTPMRPQMPGESFVERTAKNAGLAMVEAFLMQGVLAVRQLVLPPSDDSRYVQQEQQHSCSSHQPQMQQQQHEAPSQRHSLPVIQIVPEKVK